MFRRFLDTLRYARPYRTQLILGVVFNVLSVVFSVISIPAIIPFLRILFGQKREVSAPPPEWAWEVESILANINYEITVMVAERGESTALLYICGGIVLIYFLKNLFRYLAQYVMADVRNGISRDIRNRLYDKMLRLPVSWFTEQRKGDLLSRATSDVQEVEYSILSSIEAYIKEPLSILGALAIMLYMSPSLTAFVFGLIVVSGLLIGNIGKSLKRRSRGAQERLGQLISQLEETLGGMRVIKAFNAEGYQSGKYRQENDRYRREMTQIIRQRDLASPFSEFMGVAVAALLLWYGAQYVFAGELDGAAFIAYLFAFFNVLTPAKSFSGAYFKVQKGAAAAERVAQILDAPEIITDKPDARPISGLHEGIRFEGVGFEYLPGIPVLQGIDLEIPRGQVVALVGASGAGKSTMADLLPRFYDVTEGRILLDGIDLRDIRLHDLRSLTGIVTQEAILFNDTIYNNIVFGLEGVTQAQVESAARIANAHDFIMASESGYRTVIGDRGSRLSGGQRQRLTIARAILKNPPLLILDEATAALDSESERLVQDALEQLMQQRTSLVIAHRLSTIQNADLIVVMSQGRIIEQGTHTELMAHNGDYRRLVEIQMIGTSAGSVT